MNLSICAPDRQYKNKKTCFSKKSLLKIANAYNNKAKNSDKIKISENLNELHKNIEKKMQKVCNNETCWINQSFIKNIQDPEIHLLTFKPERPPNKTQWLSTIDIRKVMIQYQKKFPDFYFIGPVPIDFDEINTEISKLNLSKLKKKGINKIGIVFNLDEHYKSGSHWVGLYMEFSDKRNEINFFDSYGDKPEYRIERLINKLKKNANKSLNKDLTINVNNTRFQYAHSECGVYSMNFILHLLMGDSFKESTSSIITDEEINNRRNLLFRKN